MNNDVFGQLPSFKFDTYQKLDHISRWNLGCELLNRLQSDSNFESLSDGDISLFSALEKVINQRLEIFANRFSLTWLRGQFYGNYRYWQNENYKIPIKDATYIEVGAGAINPFGLMFMYLMLGAKKCISLEPDNLQNKRLILRNLAETAGKLLINPQKVLFDYPVTREEILANISSFKLDALQEGKEEGLNPEKLVYLQESLFNNSISNDTADVVISSSVLEHLPKMESAIQEMYRITKSGGYGIHNIDGIDHWSYSNPEMHPLEFLTIETDEEIVHISNRIRPLNFKEIFERNGFEVLEIRPYGKVEVSQELRNSFVEPFRSMSQELLEVTQAYFLVRKK
jgi:ubiquinone/menaquinone biosynthesis C-methylase UbiE